MSTRATVLMNELDQNCHRYFGNADGSVSVRVSLTSFKTKYQADDRCYSGMTVVSLSVTQCSRLTISTEVDRIDKRSELEAEESS